MSVAGRNSERCTAVRSDGTPCTAAAVRNGLCIGHQPNADKNRAKGGAATSNAARADKLLPSRLRLIAGGLEGAFVQVSRGLMEPRVAVAMATVARAIVALYQAGEYEERLRQLEENAKRLETERY